MPLRAVVTDLDNTLYPWVDYIVPSLEAMVASLEQTTRRPRIDIIQSLKAVYARHGSNEYPFAIQESSLFHPYESDFDSFDALVVRPAQRAFADARRRYLTPYPAVRATLLALKDRGIPVVALTDAPRNAVEYRVRLLELDGLLDALYALRSYRLPRNVNPEIRRRDAAGYYNLKQTKVVELPRTAEKPAPVGLRRVLRDLGLDASEVLYVGDNVKKDMALAQACGVLGVWAEYGTYISAEYRDRLAVISAKSVTRRHVSDEVADPGRRAPPERWPLAISSFAQVLEVLEGARWTRPLAAARERAVAAVGAPAIRGRGRARGRRPRARARAPAPRRSPGAPRAP